MDKPIIKYKLDRDGIQRRELVKITEHYIFFMEEKWCGKGLLVERKELVKPDTWFDTFEDAKARAISLAAEDVERARRYVYRAEGHRNAVANWEEQRPSS